ncbi:MAG: FHA domain-containing protein [Bacteroidaceae bacterium]|nr:FHA domain-containing protein [Bacteroidaceae bacterium]
MDIIIGRDAETARLVLTTDGKQAFFGQPGNVPAGVATEHCCLTITGNQTVLRNIDVNNYTYVNGQSIESKVITRDDVIELGTDHYQFRWESVSALVADIRPLQQIWNEYERQNMKITIDERRFNTLRSVSSVITMLAIAMSLFTGGRSKLYFFLYALAIIVSLILLFKSYRDASKIPQRRQNLNRQFQHDYTCPHCHRFLGNQSYELLAQNDLCPYCKTKFIH